MKEIKFKAHSYNDLDKRAKQKAKEKVLWSMIGNNVIKGEEIIKDDLGYFEDLKFKSAHYYDIGPRCCGVKVYGKLSITELLDWEIKRNKYTTIPTQEAMDDGDIFYVKISSSEKYMYNIQLIANKRLNKKEKELKEFLYTIVHRSFNELRTHLVSKINKHLMSVSMNSEVAKYIEDNNLLFLKNGFILE